LSHFYIRERLLAALSVFFGAFALVLAATGVYATVSHSIAVRVPEIGIRMALGASSVSILRLILARVVSLMTIGLIAGTLLAIWTGRLVRTLLYGVDGNDPLTYAWVILMLTLVTAAAGWLPTRRAARIDPAAVLRRP
jgi:putative ABC transport system permease protein